MSDWQQRQFGNTGLVVSALGFGAGHIGSPSMDEATAGRILNEVLDAGITLIDTARGYGLSEERIGRHLSQRRSEYVLSTKVGYDVPGYTDWTGECVSAGIDTALQRLQTDYLDIVHLHSCPVETLQNETVIPALVAAVKAGKIRVAAYSGDNEPLTYAVENTDRFGASSFGSLETSINICDQRVIDNQLATARAKGMGVIAKRPVANVPWRYSEQPVGQYVEEYWLRFQAMQLDPHDYDWQELALRFVAYLPGVHSCIVGTANVEHLRQNLAIIQKGALPGEVVDYLRQTFKSHDNGWVGQV